jgi:4-hydroxy-tetrahydrodipicolinate synthase
VFAIPPTPFRETGEVDEVSLERCVDFCIAAGAHGIVMGVNASEAIALTDTERQDAATLVVSRAAGRVTARIGADAVIAMPPYVRHPPAGEIVDFYTAVAKAADGLPVWIQDFVAPIGTPMPATLLARLLREIPGVDFLKEESDFAPQVMTAVREEAGDAVRGMMGGMAGRYLIEEYRRGACGTMPACEVADAHVLVWDALDRGDEAGARRLHTILLPLLNYEAMYSFTIYKEILYRRGVIASPQTRVPGAARLDAENYREIDALMEGLTLLLTLGHTPNLTG